MCDNKLKKEEFINNICILAKQLGRVPTYLEYQQACRQNGWQTNVRDYFFDRWSNALIEAGLKKGKIKNYN